MNTSSFKGFCREQKGKFYAAAAALLLSSSVTLSTAQEVTTRKIIKGEKYGHTLNLGVGIGYYGYLGNTVPFVFANYEIDVARNFTLAPFIGFSSYRSAKSYHYDHNYYYYNSVVVPVGVKGAYYFDQILGANSHWDFYLAASVGFVYHREVWDAGYYGDKAILRAASPLYLDGHIGAEYHLGRNAGLFLDLSTGVSTFGLAIHHL
jgi:hypothetical protein